MPTATNYIKLSVRGSKQLHDFQTIHPRRRGVGGGTTSWVWFFDNDNEHEARKALAAAFEKRENLIADFPKLNARSFQISSWLPSAFHGVPEVGAKKRFVADMAAAMSLEVVS